MRRYHLATTLKGHSRAQCPLTVIELSTYRRAAVSSTDVKIPLTGGGKQEQ